MAKTHRFDNVPSPRLMHTIGETALTDTESVGELIANCIDARLDNEVIQIDVHISDTEILIVDNGKGMDLDTLQNAIRLGVNMDEISGKRRNRMGTFGLGMKTAAANLGRKWGIITRPHATEKSVEYLVEFDLPAFERRGATSADWSVEIVEQTPDFTNALGNNSHGTVIWISNIRTRDPSPGPFLRFLSRGFSPYIKEGIAELRVNGTVVTVEEFNLFPELSYEINEVVNEEQGWHITGWVGVDKQTHNKGDYGLHLYRKGQLVDTWNKSFFSAHLMTSRIMGEVHLDYVPVNFNKKGFEVSSEEWKITVAVMKEKMRPAVQASRTMSRGRGDTGREHRAREELNRVLGRDPSQNIPVETAASTPESIKTPAASPPEAPEQFEPYASGGKLFLVRGTIEIVSTTDEFESVDPWTYVYSEKKRELLVVVNTASRVFQETRKEVEFLSRIAIADCLVLFLLDREGFKTKDAVTIRNRWLDETFESAQKNASNPKRKSDHQGLPS